MRIFVTGAPGFIGSALVSELIQAGHHVLGLTRSEGGAEALRAAGAEVKYGNLEDLDSLRDKGSRSGRRRSRQPRASPQFKACDPTRPPKRSATSGEVLPDSI